MKNELRRPESDKQRFEPRGEEKAGSDRRVGGDGMKVDTDVLASRMDGLLISKTTYIPPHMRRATHHANSCEVSTQGSRWDYANPYKSAPPSRRGKMQRFSLTPRPRNVEEELLIFGDRPVNTGINFSKYDDIPVEAAGNNVPKPLEGTFQDAIEIHPLVKENITLAAYSRPTPVQKSAIPIVCNGLDIMACAQTGSGKTAAFLVPIVSQLLNAGPPTDLLGQKTTHPLALILAPTRELSTQIFEESRKFSYRSWVRPVVLYGGTDHYPQIRDLSNGADIVVATPGRLIDMIERGRVNLDRIRYLVLDEADRMLDMGFEPYIRQIVQSFGMPVKTSRQTLLFSATFAKPIQILARDFLNEYIFLKIGRVGSTSENIVQHVVLVEESEKRSYLIDLLSRVGSTEKVLIFVEKKRDADVLENALIRDGFGATSIHGDRTQEERESALRRFRAASTPILVATAVASRGLDIPNVHTVIIYDFPSDLDEYVHRIGRTGRAGHTGNAISFFSRNDSSLASGLVSLLRESRQPVPQFLEKFSHPGNSSAPKRGSNRPSRSARPPGPTNLQSPATFANNLRWSDSPASRTSPSPPQSWEDPKSTDTWY